MIFSETPLKGSHVISIEPHSDERGWFARYYCEREFEQIGHKASWVQMNQSTNYKKGTLRGLHFQYAPFKEIKLVRCIVGAVADVIVDLREGSPTFLQHFMVELSASNGKMIYIPKGFAHGFQCLTDNCTLLYHHTSHYNPEAEGGMRYNDPLLGIHWPIDVTVISERDSNHPHIDSLFKGI
jgi:dTDP-4-dehydrorhamnose 3,5-epimerase